MSDPLATLSHPSALQQDERLRAMFIAFHPRAVYPANSRCRLWSGRNRARFALLPLDHTIWKLFTPRKFDSVSVQVPIPEDGLYLHRKTGIYIGAEEVLMTS